MNPMSHFCSTKTFFTSEIRFGACPCRKGSHGTGTYALPGGHLEFSETFGACAIRETLEETGLSVTNTKVAWVENSVWGEGDAEQHYVTVFVEADMVDAVSLQCQCRIVQSRRIPPWSLKS